MASASSDSLVFGNILPNGNGRFADVKFGTLDKSHGQQETVAVKLNKVHASENDIILLNEKMNFLDKIPPHVNVLKVLGAIPPPQGPMIITEYCELGRLSDWLKGTGEITGTVEDQMQDFCKQVAFGMAHLHALQILHKRLGARNILLAQDHTCKYVAKVTGFGPKKDEHEVSKKGDRIPLRWMAPEQFRKVAGLSRIYSKEADVWSYGILTYEVFSKGEQPYPNVIDEHLKDTVKHGYRMEMPKECPEFLYEKIVKPCWSSNPKDRPDFETIITALKMYIDGRDTHQYVQDIDDGYLHPT